MTPKLSWPVQSAGGFLKLQQKILWLLCYQDLQPLGQPSSMDSFDKHKRRKGRYMLGTGKKWEKRKEKKVKLLSRVWLFATPWTVAYQAPPSMEFSRQEYWSGLPFPSPGHLPDPGLSLSAENLVEQRHLWVDSLNYSSKPRVRCVAKAFIHIDSHQSTASFVKGKRGKRREVLAHRKWVRGVDVDVSP